MTTITVNRPATVAEPRGAAWAADIALRLLDLARSGRRVLQAQRVVADRTSEAAEVRRLADSLRDVDPRYAADLYAAADRHERG